MSPTPARITGMIFALALLLAGSTGMAGDPPGRAQLVDYLAAHHQAPEAYIIGQFRDHDLVFLGEAHVLKESLDFVQGLIPHLYRAGITHLGYEFAHHADQADIDRLITADAYDEALARRILLRFNPLWGYREYVDVFKAAWQVNHDRAAGAPAFRVVALNSDFDWSRLPPGMDPDSTEAKNLIFGGGRHYHDVVNEKWADVIAREFITPGKKALIHCGWGHSSTKFQRDRSPNLAHFRSAGNLVYNVIGDRAVEILLHQPPGYAKDHGPFLDAIHEAVSALPPDLQRGGFDTRGTPFGDLPASSRGYYRGKAAGFSMADVHDGYVYLGPPDRFTPVGVIADFVTPDNLDDANRQLRVEKGKAYTPDEINAMIPGTLKRRFDSQMRR
ncbi:hypothetical protein TA3x_003653 [Tundrisphaera sp. TA3]|uniref:hypothetical protein n=1 Tax=Tundrisphaera sp. TA3 TaxID=3435775 RepID=UPI003EBF2A53